VPALMAQGIRGASLVRFRYVNGKVETVDDAAEASSAAAKQRTAIA